MTSPGPLGDQGQGSQVSKGESMKDASGTAAAATVARLPQSPHLPERDATTTIVFSLLGALTSSDNDARNRAEQAFNALKENSPAALLYGLLQGLGSKQLPPHVRGLSALLLRRALLVEEPSLWDCLPPASDMVGGGGVAGGGDGNPGGIVGAGVEGGQRELQACLLQALSDEEDASVRRKVGDLVGELGRAVLDEEGPEGWPEFLPYVLQAAASAGMSNDSTSNNTNTARNSTSSSNNMNGNVNFNCNFNTNSQNVNSNSNGGGGGGALQAGSPAATAAAVLAAGGGGGKEGSCGTGRALARVVTGLRLMSSAAQHVAIAAAADPSAFQVLVETLQRCLCWQPQQQQQQQQQQQLQQQQEAGGGLQKTEGGGGGGDGTGFQDVRMEAVRALGSVVVACARPSEQTSFSTCLPHLMQAIQATLSSGDRLCQSGVWYCCETLELAIELAEACPAFLRPRVSQFVNGMVQVAGDRSAETSVRHLALEFLVSIVEAAPAMCRKMGDGDGSTSAPASTTASGPASPNSPAGVAIAGDGMAGVGEGAGGGVGGGVGGGGGGRGGGQNSFAATVIPVCFSMMTELPENASWAMGESEEEDSVEDNVCEVGSEALERVAQALGARAALPQCRRLVREGLGGWTWQHQHAALSALGVLADAYNQPQGDEGLEMRAEALSQVLPFVSCSRPRVQNAALWSLERMAEDHSSGLEEDHFEAIMPALLACLDPANGCCPRVVHRALLALVQVLEAGPDGGVMPHAETLLERCVMLIRQGTLMVQEAAVSLVSTVAETGQEGFGRFYDVVMPFLMQVLSSCPAAEQRLLRGKALECVSLVGSTVDKERFAVDALSVMQLMVQAQASGLEDDDPTRVYMLRAWVRICKCLGPDFVPYLPLLMPPLLAAASAIVEVELPSAGGDGDGVDIDDLDSDVDCMEGLDGEVVAVRTWALEEQATACQMILLLAEALQEHFLPYVENVAGQLARLVNTSPHDDVRTFCMAAMPELVRSCGKAAVMPGSELEGGRVRQLLEFCLCRLLESLDREEDAELLMTAAQACKRCVFYACVRWETHTEGALDCYYAGP